MQKTHDFKVGDIVRFKADEEHQKYAMHYYDRTTNLKISKILKMRCGPDLVNFEGYHEGLDAFTFRLEKQPNMFAFGKKNPKIKKVFLDYIAGYRYNGLCNFVIGNSKAQDFLKSQKVFEVNADTPVEYFILRSKKKSTKNAWYNYTNTFCSFNDPSTPEGRLRIWWATNLAIAASQGNI